MVLQIRSVRQEAEEAAHADEKATVAHLKDATDNGANHIVLKSESEMISKRLENLTPFGDHFIS